MTIMLNPDLIWLIKALERGTSLAAIAFSIQPNSGLRAKTTTLLVNFRSTKVRVRLKIEHKHMHPT